MAMTIIGGRTHAVTGGDDGTVRVWNLTTGEQTAAVTGHTGSVLAVATTTVDGRPHAVTGGSDGTVRVWNLTTGEQTGAALTGHAGWVRAVATTTLDGRPHAVTGGDDRTVRVWDLTTGEQTAAPVTGHTGRVLAVATATVDGRPHAVTGSSDSTVRVWNLATGKQAGAPLTGHNGWVRAVATTTLDGRPHAVTGSDGTVRVWNLTTGEQTAALTGHTGWVRAVATTTVDGRAHAVTGGDDRTVRVWDLTTGKQTGAALTGHTGSVLTVVTGTLDGRAHAVTGGSDGTVRVWNLTTGKQTGAALTGHLGSVLAVATTTVDGRPHAVTGGSDGIIRVWDLTTGKQAGAALTGHTGWVRAVATSTLDGRPHAVTGGDDDGTVRVWNLTTGGQTAVLTGHLGRVGAVATATVDGRPHAVTGGDDGTVRVWNLTTGEQTAALTGHTGWVRAVATATLDGRAHAVTGGSDGTVRVWNLTTGEQTAALTGHTGWVRAVATTTLDGRPHAFTGGDTGAVRVWDPRSGAPIVEFPAHDQAVVTLVTENSSDSRPMVLTGGFDGLLRAWSLDQLLTASASGIDEVFAGENTDAEDRLSRESLAAHLIERLHQLTSSSRSQSATLGDLTGSGIIHVDGRWGAGKTTFIELMLRSWSPADSQPVVVRYDAWRQAAIAPEWWSVASETRRAVHQSRAAPTRIVMTVGGFLRRLIRSTSTWVALFAVLALTLFGRWFVTGPANLPQQLDAVSKLLTTIAGVLAVAFIVTRNLFWSAPVLGRLHVRTDDNPLGEVSGIIGHLRRWSPRPGAPQRLADWLVTLWLAISAVMTIWWHPLWSAWRNLPANTELLVARIASAGALVVAGLLLRTRVRRLVSRLVETVDRWRRLRPSTVFRLLVSKRTRASRNAQTRKTDTTAQAAKERTQGKGWSRRLQRLLVGTIIIACVTFALWLIGPILSDAVRRLISYPDRAQLIWTLAGVLGIAGYVIFLAVIARRPRRMVLLMIDDLDRCEEARVVRLLEAVHTVLRERAAPRRLTRWRAPAPFGVLVVANGAWIRDAFSKHYETFNGRNNDDTVHDLGADFLQKIFDHSVLVPGLSPQQTEELIHVVARSPYHRASAAPADDMHRDLLDPTAGGATSRDPEQKLNGYSAIPTALTEGAATHPIEGKSQTTIDAPPPSAPEAGSSPTQPQRQAAHDPASSPAFPTQSSEGAMPPSPLPQFSAGASAARDDLGSNARGLITHLLTNYHTILPRNPRLIIRVATSWAMLRAVARSLELEVDAEPANELLVRAAVIWVRFPVLVDLLLDADRPPSIDPDQARCDPKWRRQDVQRALHLNDGRLLNIKDLALYYGKFFDDPARPAIVPLQTDARLIDGAAAAPIG